MKNLTYLFHSRFGKYLKLILIFCAAFLTGRLLAKITSSEIISPDITALSVSSDPSGNWGISFQEKGKQPLGNASIQELKQYNAFYVQDTDSKNIYLTFDAGYENGNTSAILDALKKHQVPATFFVVGNFLSQNPDLIKRMEKDLQISLSSVQVTRRLMQIFINLSAMAAVFANLDSSSMVEMQ